jgi:hypothetical protein
MSESREQNPVRTYMRLGHFLMESTSMEENKFEIPKQLESLLGQPPLLEGEDREAYLALRAALIEDRQPKTVMDWIHVHDLVTQLWEEQRYRRASAAIIRGAMLAAVVQNLILGWFELRTNPSAVCYCTHQPWS